MAFRQSSFNVVKRIIKPSLYGKSRLCMTATAVPKITDTSNKYPIDVISRRFKKSTKQLATLGPASNNVEMIETNDENKFKDLASLELKTPLDNINGPLWRLKVIKLKEIQQQNYKRYTF